MEWLDPPFTAGHWVPEMIRLADGHDELAREGWPSSQIAWSRIADYDPEILVLMPCGFTLERTVEECAQVKLPGGLGSGAGARLRGLGRKGRDGALPEHDAVVEGEGQA
jgi:iron complex transport system substrate-binding protein